MKGEQKMDGKTRKEAAPTHCTSNWHALPMETPRDMGLEFCTRRKTQTKRPMDNLHYQLLLSLSTCTTKNNH